MSKGHMSTAVDRGTVEPVNYVMANLAFSQSTSRNTNERICSSNSVVLHILGLVAFTRPGPS